MLSAGVGGPVPEEYLPMIREEMMLDDIDPKTVHWRNRPDDAVLERRITLGRAFEGRRSV